MLFIKKFTSIRSGILISERVEYWRLFCNKTEKKDLRILNIKKDFSKLILKMYRNFYSAILGANSN